jgi:hypothetical protein
MDDYGSVLADAIVAAIPGWVRRSVRLRMMQWGGDVPPAADAAAGEAGTRAAAEVGAAIRHLLVQDVDSQATTPLAILRTAVRYPTAVLREAGVPAVDRDGYSERAFPEDPYDLTPAKLADVDPALAEPGYEWGAAKALEHMRRHSG